MSAGYRWKDAGRRWILLEGRWWIAGGVLEDCWKICLKRCYKGVQSGVTLVKRVKIVRKKANLQIYQFCT